jgi:hypothetical protein
MSDPIKPSNLTRVLQFAAQMGKSDQDVKAYFVQDMIDYIKRCSDNDLWCHVSGVGAYEPLTVTWDSIYQAVDGDDEDVEITKKNLLEYWDGPR